VFLTALLAERENSEESSGIFGIATTTREIPAILALLANQFRALARGIRRVGHQTIREKESFYRKQCVCAFCTK